MHGLTLFYVRLAINPTVSRLEFYMLRYCEIQAKACCASKSSSGRS